MCSAIVNTYLGSQSVFAKMRKRFSKSRVRTFSWRSKVLNQGMSHFIYPAGHASFVHKVVVTALSAKQSWSRPCPLFPEVMCQEIKLLIKLHSIWAIFCGGFVAHFNHPDQVVVWDNYYIVKAFAMSHCCLNARIPIPLVCAKEFWSGHQRLNIAGGNGILHSPVHTQVANERLY